MCVNLKGSMKRIIHFKVCVLKNQMSPFLTAIFFSRTQKHIWNVLQIGWSTNAQKSHTNVLKHRCFYQHHFRPSHFDHNSNSSKVSFIITIPILQRKQLRPKHVQCLLQTWTANKCQDLPFSWGLVTSMTWLQATLQHHQVIFFLVPLWFELLWLAFIQSALLNLFMKTADNFHCSYIVLLYF